jgi:predicted Zn-dependent protease with MMP-like domain
MDTERFEQLVAQAIESLPDEFMERLENVDIVIADEPSSAQRKRSELPKNETLLGLYEGVPLTERSSNYGFVVPDKITIFQKCIESSFRSDARIVKEIRRVVLHEIAHHFGIDDDRLDELGM